MRWNSCLMSGISGAHANHAKKQTKNAIHAKWKARMAGVRQFSRSIDVALSVMFRACKRLRRPANRVRDQIQGTPLSKIRQYLGDAALRLVVEPLWGDKGKVCAMRVDVGAKAFLAWVCRSFSRSTARLLTDSW
ncbi:hypothetical protein PCAR4_140185 [Paraburkholderia caribensis]|nr:hypothetical protein PCAR4_140185 [Paraburkholderia caribensis]